MNYSSPLGNIVIRSEGKELSFLQFHEKIIEEKSCPVLKETKEWLDLYFKGSEPNFTPKLSFSSLTEFQKVVLKETKGIPFGSVITYQELAKKVAKKLKVPRMSAQAIGTSLSKNQIWLIIPCHRVVGTNSLGGYQGGLEKKQALLEFESPKQLKYDTMGLERK